MQSNKGSHVIIHKSVGILPFLTAENRFDVDLTGKMTEFDQTKLKFGILSKFPTIKVSSRAILEVFLL